MHRIDGAGHVNHLFVAEDPAALRPPTEITPEIMNAFQEELATFVEWAGIVLNKGDNTQLKNALLAKFATIANLAAFAPINSPAFTNAPTAPTPAQFDNSGKLATTGFVKNSGLLFSAYSGLNGNGAIPVSSLGSALSFGGTMNAATLPDASSVRIGDAILLFNATSSGGAVTVSALANQTIFIGSSTVQSYVHGYTESALLVCIGANTWAMVGGSMLLSRSASLFGSSAAASGYQKLPSGLMLQWGRASLPNSNVQHTFSFPVAFPNACLSLVGIEFGSTPTIGYSTTAWTASQFNLICNVAGTVASWIAIGN